MEVKNALAAEAVDAAGGSEPEIALFVLADAGHAAGPQAVLDGEISKSFAIEAMHVAAGAGPVEPDVAGAVPVVGEGRDGFAIQGSGTASGCEPHHPLLINENASNHFARQAVLRGEVDKPFPVGTNHALQHAREPLSPPTILEWRNRILGDLDNGLIFLSHGRFYRGRLRLRFDSRRV